MSFWAKLFSKEKTNKEVVIAVAATEGIKLFKSIDDAIIYLSNQDNKKSIEGLEKLRERIEGQNKVKAIRITEDNEIIEYENLKDLKNNIS